MNSNNFDKFSTYFNVQCSHCICLFVLKDTALTLNTTVY